MIAAGLELFDRAVNWPGPRGMAWAAAAGVAVVLIAGLLLALGRLRVLARVLGVLGLLPPLLVLIISLLQTQTERPAAGITVVRPRYPENVRFWARVGLLGLPAAVVGVMVPTLLVTRRRLRATVPKHLKEAVRLTYQGDLDAALAACERAVELGPERGDVYCQRGRVYELKGEVDRALADFDRAARLDPQLAVAFLHRGRLLAARNEVDAALEDFGRVLKIRPNDAEALLHRGTCLARKGLVEEAAGAFQWVLRLTNDEQYAEPARQQLRRIEAERAARP
jgi:tetratricopeptide (TPR) repeat protein